MPKKITRVDEADKEIKAPSKRRKKVVLDQEPSWVGRRNDDDDDDVGDDDESVDIRELFKPKNKRENAATAHARGVAIGDQDLPQIGVAFPSLCLEMFTGLSVLPASSCYALGGPTGSFKSHFVMEIARWIAKAGGFTLLAENESKYNPDMAQAVMGRKFASKVWVEQCQTFNEVEEALIEKLKQVNALARDSRMPLLEIVDSIVGNATEGQNKKIDRDGSIERGYPSNALAAANFLPSYMPRLNGKPYFGVWVTHHKMAQDDYGNEYDVLKGGDNWQYRCRLAFVLRRMSKNPKWDDRVWAVKLGLSLIKDSSVRGFRLPVVVRSTGDIIHDKESNDTFFRRKVRFCWDEASLELLMNPASHGYPEDWAIVAKDVLGFDRVKVSGRYVYVATQLGITKEDAIVDPKAIMDALYDTPDILDRLRAEFGIQKGIVMSRGDDFLTLMERAKQIAIRREALLRSKDETVFIRKGEFRVS